MSALMQLSNAVVHCGGSGNIASSYASIQQNEVCYFQRIFLVVGATASLLKMDSDVGQDAHSLRHGPHEYLSSICYKL
jgi:hypothetical protein